MEFPPKVISIPIIFVSSPTVAQKTVLSVCMF